MNAKQNIRVGSGETAGKPSTRRREAPVSKPPVMVLEAQPEQTLAPYDENLLERARTQWQFGDWQSLAGLDRDTLQHNPDRAKLTLLAAAGRLQTGQDAEARQYIRLAQDWGVSKKLISQILIAGVHNSLGRSAALAGQQPQALKHFESAIRVGTPGGDIRLLAQARINEQLQQLKILGQKTQFLEKAGPLSKSGELESEPAVYPLHINLSLNKSIAALLGVNAAQREWFKVLHGFVEYQTEQGAPLYLVSNENGNFENPPRKAQIHLKANTAYLIAGKIDHRGDNRPIIWIFQYAQGKKIDAQSIKTEAGQFQHRFSTKLEMESFAIGIRLVGNGILHHENTLIDLQEQTAEEIAAQFEEKITRLQQAQKSEVENSMKQIEACIRLQSYLGAETILPDLHNWPISPDFGVLLINLAEQNGYDLVIEFGSGTSTLILARALERVGRRDGRTPSPLLSFDHLKEYHEKTRNLLKQAAIIKHVSVVLAPLVAWQSQQGDSFSYYACDEALHELKRCLPDSATRVLVIVDGPPAATGRHARYPALPMVLDVFPPEKFTSHFLLDDYLRADEQEIAARWLTELDNKKVPNRRTEFNKLEKKACLIEVSREQTD